MALLFFARLLLGGVFIVSAVPKLLTPRRIISDVQNYRILPRPLAAAFGWALPPVELASGLALLSGYGALWGAAAVLVLLTSFIVAVGIAMYRKQSLTCTCFGLLYRERVGWNTQVRDGVLWLIALAVLLGPTAPTFGELVTGGSALGVAGALLTLAVLALALGLGWVAARGWPQWVVRLRARQLAPPIPAGGQEQP